MKSRYFSFFILILVPFLALTGQDKYVRFKRITINDGLSLSSVYCIYQDSKGFMWFGTEDGLNKYDGQSITVFGATTDQHYILANKWIELIYEDKSGMIWLGSAGGLTRYNPRKGIFNVFHHDPGSIASLSNDTVTCIDADLRNNVWVGTAAGLNRVNRLTNEVERIQPQEKELAGLTSGINGFLQDNSGIFWIATENGLYSHDVKSGLFFSETAGDLIDEHTPVLGMIPGNDVIWLATGNGLIRLDMSGRRQHRKILPELGTTGESILAIRSDNLGQIWILTRDRLYCYQPQADKLHHILDAEGSTHSLSLHPVESLLVDGEGYIWFGSFGNGVFRIDPGTFEYRQYLHNPADPQSISENSINTIFEDRAGSLWFGTFGAGISILDPMANRFTIFKNDPFDENSLSSSFIWTICEASSGRLWLGTNNSGISRYDPATGRFTHYNHDPGDPSSLSHSSVRKIYQDSRGRIWAGTDGGGLNLYLPSTGGFKHYMHDPGDNSSISNNSVRAIYEDRQGRIWVGTRQGLNLLDETTGNFRRYMHLEGDPS
ncbi:MAG: hypothetical protein EHM46_02910, partial [Bacteroidetes bacterium]